jgi:hypothetical protein
MLSDGYCSVERSVWAGDFLTPAAVPADYVRANILKNQYRRDSLSSEQFNQLHLYFYGTIYKILNKIKLICHFFNTNHRIYAIFFLRLSVCK